MKSFGFVGFAVSLAACLAGVMESAAAQLDAEVKAPAFVKAKAFAWFDASDKDSFTLDASGKVEKWADKSGKGNDATAYVEKGVKARGKVGEANGVPAFLMGKTGSGIDLKFPVDTNIRTVFQVMDWSKISPNACFLACTKDVVGA